MSHCTHCGQPADGIDARSGSPSCSDCAATTDDESPATQTDRIVADGGSTDPVTDSYPRLKYTPQPADYHSWPRDAKLSYLTEQYDRIQIAAAIRREIGILDRLGKQRLNAMEIAAISLDMGIQL